MRPFAQTPALEGVAMNASAGVLDALSGFLPQPEGLRPGQWTGLAGTLTGAVGGLLGGHLAPPRTATTN